jgi:hypothetical protein
VVSDRLKVQADIMPAVWSLVESRMRQSAGDVISSGGLHERDRLRAVGTEAIMRNRLYIALLLLAGSLGQIGCIVPIYSSSPDIRARQLIFVSEGYRHIPEIWERIWGLDMPDVATPYRTHGGVI